MEDLQKEVKQLSESLTSMEAVRDELLQNGYLKEDIDKALQNFAPYKESDKTPAPKTESKKFLLKEIFDRIGYGLGGEQYVNILFNLSGASYPLIAIANGIKAVLTSLTSSFAREYSQEKGIDKRMMGSSGVIYGYCLIMMAVAVLLSSPVLFMTVLLVGAFGIVLYGEFYQHILKETLSEQKRGAIANIYKYGLLITVASLLVSAFIMDRLEIITIDLSIFGIATPFWFFSYLAIFETAALFFILSGYVVSQINTNTVIKKRAVKEMIEFVPEYYNKIRANLSTMLRNKPMLLLILASSLTGFVQLFGNSFYGIFVYKNFFNYGFGGFLNVAMISILALITSLLTPMITKENTKLYGKYPMLIFGTVLMAIMPLAFFYNPNLVSIGMGTILGVTGAAIVGIANGLLFSDILPRNTNPGFYGAYTFLNVIPYILIVPLGAYITNLLGISRLFLILSLILLLLVVPIYFIMMLSPKLTQNAKL